MNKSAITMSLSGPECKMILRLRQLRKSGETSLFLVSTNPITISVCGNIELLESGASGSGTSW
jgi:hypothetical protein